MATNPLFSTYRTGENRVTSSMMAVFERLDLALVREILAGAFGAGDELRAVTFENQVVADGAVPDARISGHFAWWFETKTTRGSYLADGHNRDQLIAHSGLLAADPDAQLFVITPDPVRPAWFDGFGGRIPLSVAPRIIWLSFRAIASTIEGIMRESERLLSEQSRFLLAELLQLFEADGLLTNDDTVIVAAREAWPFYLQSSAYTCQPNRTFREGLTHLGFYAEGAIQPFVPKILQPPRPKVLFTRENARALRQAGDQEIAQVIERALETSYYREDQAASHEVFILSPKDSDETVKLDAPVVNDSTTATGKPSAWTMGQRYTSIDRLTAPEIRLTSQL